MSTVLKSLRAAGAKKRAEPLEERNRNRCVCECAPGFRCGIWGLDSPNAVCRHCVMSCAGKKLKKSCTAMCSRCKKVECCAEDQNHQTICLCYDCKKEVDSWALNTLLNHQQLVPQPMMVSPQMYAQLSAYLPGQPRRCGEPCECIPAHLGYQECAQAPGHAGAHVCTSCEPVRCDKQCDYQSPPSLGFRSACMDRCLCKAGHTDHHRCKEHRHVSGLGGHAVPLHPSTPISTQTWVPEPWHYLRCKVEVSPGQSHCDVCWSLPEL